MGVHEVIAWIKFDSTRPLCCNQLAEATAVLVVNTRLPFLPLASCFPRFHVRSPRREFACIEKETSLIAGGTDDMLILSVNVPSRRSQQAAAVISLFVPRRMGEP